MAIDREIRFDRDVVILFVVLLAELVNVSDLRSRSYTDRVPQHIACSKIAMYFGPVAAIRLSALYGSLFASRYLILLSAR